MLVGLEMWSTSEELVFNSQFDHRKFPKIYKEHHIVLKPNERVIGCRFRTFDIKEGFPAKNHRFSECVELSTEFRAALVYDLQFLIGKLL